MRKKEIYDLGKDPASVKEERNIFKKESVSTKEEILKIRKKNSLVLETLEHILSIQVPYYNKLGLWFEKECQSRNPFPKATERLRQKPPTYVSRANLESNLLYQSVNNLIIAQVVESLIISSNNIQKKCKR